MRARHPISTLPVVSPNTIEVLVPAATESFDHVGRACGSSSIEYSGTLAPVASQRYDVRIKYCENTSGRDRILATL